MRGHKRFKDGAWRLVVDAGKDPITGKRRQVNRTVRAPNTRAGAQAADVELARLIIDVTAGEAAPSAHITVGELLVRWVEHRRRAWEAPPSKTTASMSGAGAASVSAHNGYGRSGCSRSLVEEGFDEGEERIGTPNHLHVDSAGQHC
jgi:hypothetical protein